MRNAATRQRMRDVGLHVAGPALDARRTIGEKSVVAADHTQPGRGRFELDGVGSVPRQGRVCAQRWTVDDHARPWGM